MSDIWEDWENEDFVIPVLNVPNEKQLNLIKERKLVEESDNNLAKDLFAINKQDLVYEDLNQSTEKKAPKNKTNISNRQLNEEKQKNLSKVIKEKKVNKQREKELFGEPEGDEYDEYIKYEDKFH